MTSKNSPIAIIGMGNLFPEARDLDEYWKNICSGTDAIKSVPETHWKISDYYDSDVTAEDKTYCKKGGFIPDTEFSPLEFGITPNSLDVTDVLQLLSLTVAKHTLNDAGYFNNEAFQEVREKTGVVLGITGANSLTQPLSNRLQSPKIREVLATRGLNDDQIEDVIQSLKKAYAPWEENSFPGMLGNVVAGRIANRFDLGGTNCTVDAACASSLAALRMAIDELNTGRADMMLTGGCDAENTILMYMCFSKTPAFSKKGVISPFDVDSDGTLIGEGVGILALKRLEDAEKAGDRIYAVIKGLGSSSDGKFKSIYAPRGEGQVKCLSRAYEDAGFPISTIGLLEAHGTGTKVGDATEIGALQDALGDVERENPHIAIGSVKSQIGHTKAAAGAAGLIKTTLALHQKTLPPTINVNTPAEPFLGDKTSLYVNTETRPWLLNYGVNVRRAGVSSFGFGGTNFHVVLEEYPQQSSKSSVAMQNTIHPLVISANTVAEIENQLRALCERKDLVGLPFSSCQDYSISVGFVALNLADMKAKAELALQSLAKAPKNQLWSHPKGIYINQRCMTGKVAALFSGQGSQYVNMFRDCTLNYPEFQEHLEFYDSNCKKLSATYLSDKIFPLPVYQDSEIKNQTIQLKRTEFAQPAIGFASTAAYSAIQKLGFNADCVGGHSFGELTALWASQAISLDDFVKLSIARGISMAKTTEETDSGTMLAVALSEVSCKAFIEESGIQGLSLCNLNSYSQTVVGGGSQAIIKFSEFLKSREVRCTQLPVSAAFHTPYVEHAKDQFMLSVNKTEFSDPIVPLYKNKDGNPETNASNLKTGLCNQLLEPVRFISIIEKMYQDGVRTFVEFGPNSHLSNLVKDIAKESSFEVNVISVDKGASASGCEAFQEAIVKLAVLGCIDRKMIEHTPKSTELPESKGFTVSLNGVNYVSDSRKKQWNDSLLNVPDFWSDFSSDETGENSQPGANKAFSESETPLSELIASDSNEVDSIQGKKVGGRTQQSFGNQVQGTDLGTEFDAQSSSANKLLIAASDVATEENYEKYLSEIISTARKTVSTIEAITNGSPDSSDLNNQVFKVAGAGLKAIANQNQLTSDEHRKLLTQFEDLSESFAADFEIRDELVPTESPMDRSSTNSGEERNELVRCLANLIGEKTGYPSEVIETQMDLEADLGIDSIKKVEILGELNSAIIKNQSVDPELLMEASSIDAIADIILATNSDVVNSLVNEEITDTSLDKSVVIDDEVETGVHAVDEKISEVFLNIVSEKTGYPIDVLDMSMSMEADLGIDSIKRVEILGEMQTNFTGNIALDPNELSELDTLQDILTHIDSASGVNRNPTGISGEIENDKNGIPDSAAKFESKSNSLELTDETSSSLILDKHIDTAKCAEVFLEIVAAKTGYPEDVLEMSMSLESDLGIDSIKRVEILGELQQNIEFSDEIDNAHIVELETVGEIVEYIAHLVTRDNSQSLMDETELVDLSANSGQNDSISTEVDTPDLKQYSQHIEMTKTADNPVKSDLDITDLFLETISDKTGYPVDVIDNSMNLEADLGIDSIKTVEILGEMQASIETMVVGDVVPLDHVTLSELGSIDEVINFINRSLNSPNINIGKEVSETITTFDEPSQESTENINEVTESESAITALGDSSNEETEPKHPASDVLKGTSNKLSRLFFEIVSEKTGYPEDVLEMDMSMEGDLGIDSIKRVEILGELQGRLDVIEELNHERLGSLETIGEIMEFIAGDSARQFTDTTENSVPSDDHTDLSVVAESSEKLISAVEKESEEPSIARFSIEAKTIDPVVLLEKCYAANPSVLVVGYKQNVTSSLRKKLIQKDMNVHNLLIGGSPGILDNQSYALEQVDENTLFDLLDSIPDVDIVIFQHPSINSTSFKTLPESPCIQALQHLMLLGKYYKNKLDSGDRGRKAFFALTRMDGRLGLSNPDMKCLSAGCFGLVKTLKTETENVFCRTLDFHEEMDAGSVAEQTVKELFDMNVSLCDVGIKNGQRSTFGMSKNIENAPASILSDTSCLIFTGGGRGITAKCAIELSKKQKGKYLLVGRTKYLSEPEWASNVPDADLKKKAVEFLKSTGEKIHPRTINSLVNQITGSREIADTIKHLDKNGVEARYISIDIADELAVKEELMKDKWIIDNDSIALIHGAGSLSDKLIEKKSVSDFEKVFSAKLYGLGNIVENLELSKLKLCVLFSSVAGLFGNIGQSDYAMSNEILNRLAIKIGSKMEDPSRSVSIVWGAWNAGMVSPEIKAMFESRGISLIELSTGTQHFSDICLQHAQSATQMVGPAMGLSANETNISNLKKTSLSVKIDTQTLLSKEVLDGHSIGGQVVLPLTFAVGLVSNLLESYYGGLEVIGCDEVTVAKGIVINDELPENILIKFEIDKNEDNSRLFVDAVISNGMGQNYYYVRSMVLDKVNSEASESVNTDLVSLENYSTKVSKFYEGGTLFHTKDFRILETYENAENSMLFTCRSESKDINSFSGNRFSPLYADAILQTALVWIMVKENIHSLPMAVRDIRLFDVVNPGELIHIKVKQASSGPTQSKLNFTAHALDGRPLMMMEASLIKSKALSKKFLKVAA